MVKINWNAESDRTKAKAFPVQSYLYTADYAADVHDGEPETGRPARPWVWTSALEEDFEMAIKIALKGKAPTRENLIEAWSAVGQYFAEVLDENINEERWAWPRTTARRSGEIAGRIRDIVDSGDLRDSLIHQERFN